MQPPPWVRLNLDFSLLLLLTGDVSLNPDPGVRGLRLGTDNAHSMQDKAPALSDLVTSKGIDLLGMRHGWPQGKTPQILSKWPSRVSPSFRNLKHAERRRNGAVHVIGPYTLVISLPAQTSFEAISGKRGQLWFIFLNIYHPPGPTTTFFSELQDIMFYICTLLMMWLWLGNLRIDSSSSDAGQLSGILESCNLHQYVDFPTHTYGHSLDLMIFSTGYDVLSVSTSNLIADHFSLVASFKIPSNDT